MISDPKVGDRIRVLARYDPQTPVGTVSMVVLHGITVKWGDGFSVGYFSRYEWQYLEQAK